MPRGARLTGHDLGHVITVTTVIAVLASQLGAARPRGAPGPGVALAWFILSGMSSRAGHRIADRMRRSLPVTHRGQEVTRTSGAR
jgi:hypothetical protein